MTSRRLPERNRRHEATIHGHASSTFCARTSIVAAKRMQPRMYVPRFRSSRNSSAAPASDVTSASSSVKPVPPQYQTFGRKQNSIAAVMQVRNRKRSERASAKIAGNMSSDEATLIARRA